LIPEDTTPEAEWVQIEAFRSMPAEKRLALAFELSDSLRDVVAAGVRYRHPDYDENGVRLAVARLTLGEVLFRAAYPGVHIDV
jgi:hypothetical protein